MCRYFRIIAMVFFTLLFATELFSGTQIVRYSLGGNHRGTLYYPENIPSRMGVVIYSYDEYYSHHGAKIAKDRGYDLEEIARLFNLKGYLVFIPERRSESSVVVEGAILAMKKHPLVDSSRIHLMGISMGATSSLLAAAQHSGVASITVVTPSPITDKGRSSLADLVRKIDRIQCPIMIGVGTQDAEWRKSFGKELKTLLSSHGKEVYYEEYSATKAWFWNPRTIFMRHVYQLLEQTDGVKSPALPKDQEPELDDESTPVESNFDIG